MNNFNRKGGLLCLYLSSSLQVMARVLIQILSLFLKRDKDLWRRGSQSPFAMGG